MRVRTLFAILAIMLCISANATNYYFSDSDGDDSRSSTQAQDPSTPWKSLSKLNSFFPYLQPGDQVLFKRGDIFYGSIVTAKSGSSSSPIVFTDYGSSNTRPTISGFSVVSDWNSYGNGIYVSNELPAGSAMNMVVINGQEYAMGRYPNANSDNGGYLTFDSHGHNYINDNENRLSNEWEGAQLVVRTSHYQIERASITDISGNSISYSPSFDHSLTDKFGYFVQNSIKALDQFGEWYYNPSNHRLYVYFGSNDPSNYTVEASTIDILFTAHHSNIELNDIRLRGANKYALYNDLAGVSNLHVNNCRLVYSGLDAVAVAGTSNFLLENSTIGYSNSNAIDLYYNNYNFVVKNTSIQNTAIFQGMLQKDVGNRYGMAIYGADGLTALNNTINNTGFIGINYTGSNNLIQNNYINNFCLTLDDGAGIYTFGGNNPTYYNRRIIGNIVVNGIGAKAGTYSTDPNYVPSEGIYFDDNSTNVEVSNNTVANCANTGIYVHNAKGITIRNNVIYNNHVQIAFQHDHNGNGGVSNGVITRNQVFSKSASQLVLMLQSSDNDFNNFGTFDSNYYCRPFQEDGINYTNWFYNKDGYYNLSGWQSTYNKDWHTKKTPVSVADSSDILFQYNASTSTKTVNLDGTYIGINSVTYTGKVDLAPYTSIILLRTNGSNNNVSDKMAASASSIVNPSVKGPGYVESTNLTVQAYPNPSSYYFNVTAKGNSVETMTLRVIDLTGKLVQVKTGVSANSTLQIGQDLMAGTYILELIQGNKKVEQKIIKLSK